MGRPKGGKNREWSKEEKLKVVNYYLENNCLEEIDANLSQSQVFEKILERLKK